MVAGGRPRVSGSQTSVWASPLSLPGTGVGVHQRRLYARLRDRDIDLTVPPSPDSRLSRLRNWALLPVQAPHAAALVCTTPAPLRLAVPTVTFVYDLRWRRTRRSFVRSYRYLDLRRTVAKAQHLYAISERTREDIVGLIPESECKCSVLHLGPGIVEPSDFTDGQNGTVLLIGGRSYKRNELVAAAIARARPAWARSFLCVGVSDETYRTLSDAFGAETCTRLTFVDNDQMRALFRKAAVYVSASLEEGFGLPMIEALAAGCQVVAIRQQLTDEVVGGAAVLVEDGDVDLMAEQFEDPSWVDEGVRRAQAARYSWDRVADTVAAELLRIGC